MRSMERSPEQLEVKFSQKMDPDTYYRLPRSSQFRVSLVSRVAILSRCCYWDH